MGEWRDTATRPLLEAPIYCSRRLVLYERSPRDTVCVQGREGVKAKDLLAYVMAPTRTMDVFDELVKAERTGKNLLMLAKSYYAAGTTYTLSCRREVTTWTGDPVAPM